MTGRELERVLARAGLTLLPLAASRWEAAATEIAAAIEAPWRSAAQLLLDDIDQGTRDFGLSEDPLRRLVGGGKS